MKWTVVIPAWSQRGIDQFRQIAFPSIYAAIKHAGKEKDIEIDVYTDMSILNESFHNNIKINVRKIIPTTNKYLTMRDVHVWALQRAERGRVIMLATSDMIYSREIFTASELRLTGEKKLIVVCPSRTVTDHLPRVAMQSAELLEWTLQNLHPFVKASFHPNSRAWPPSTMRFGNRNINGDVTVRGFHLHPLAVLKDREITFKGTLDQDLFENFKPEEIYVVTDCNEMSSAEISPANLVWKERPRPVTAQEVGTWAANCCHSMNWWLAKQRIFLRGCGQTNDEIFWNEVLTYEVLQHAEHI